MDAVFSRGFFRHCEVVFFFFLCLLPDELFLCSRVSARISVQSERKRIGGAWNSCTLFMVDRYSAVWIKWHFEAVWTNFISLRGTFDGREQFQPRTKLLSVRRWCDVMWLFLRDGRKRQDCCFIRFSWSLKPKRRRVGWAPSQELCLTERPLLAVPPINVLMITYPKLL